VTPAAERRPSARFRSNFVVGPTLESQQHGHRLSYFYKNKERPVIIIFIVKKIKINKYIYIYIYI
jgi:hypothetical protein